MDRDRKRLSRRTFIQATSAATAGAAAMAGVVHAANTPPGVGIIEDGIRVDDRVFKMGIVGCGWQGQVLMREALKIIGNEFTAVCDLVPERREQARKIAGAGARSFEKFDDMLQQGRMDALLIASPLHLHHPMTMAALKRGLDVFCEKTMAYDIEQCWAMRTAAMTEIPDKGPPIIQIGHHLRYHPTYVFAQSKYISANLLGRIHHVHCQWNRNASWKKVHPEGEYNFKAYGYDTPDELFNWRLYRKFSGGVMTELASHQLDIVNWFLGSKPRTVMGIGKTDRKDGRTIFDNVDLLYEYPDDVKVTYQSITTNAYNPFGWEAYEMFKGEKGTLILAHLSPKYLGLFLLEPGASEKIWMPLAKRADFDSGNLRQDRYKKPIVLGHPSRGINFVAGIDVADLLDDESMPKKSTYELEMLEFKKAVLDRNNPTANAMVGFDSAVPVLLGLQAMEENRQIEIPENVQDLVKPPEPA